VFAGIATPGGYDPMKFVERCARAFADPAMHVEGLHVFTFNQVAETEQWRQEQLERLTPSLTA
jgi:methylenetetrahydrofolate reductase (NADPH)